MAKAASTTGASKKDATTPSSTTPSPKTTGTDEHPLKDASKARAETEAKRGQRVISDNLRSFADAVDVSAKELSGDKDWMADGVSRVSDMTNRLASDIDQMSPRQIAGRARSMARGNPGAFLLACGAIGFVAARFLRASSDHAENA